MPRSRYYGRQALANAMRGEHARTTRRAGHVNQVADVVAIDPLKLDLHESRRVIHSDELTLSQWVKRYDATDGIEVGDAVIVMEKHTGGEILWVVTDVISDNQPTV